MGDWAIYWRDYLLESGDSGEPVTDWLTSRVWLVNRLQSGDRIWLFIGGDACGDLKAPQRGYVAQLLVVDKWHVYENHDPDEPGSPQIRINGIAKRCLLVEPPALVDRIFRQPGRDPKMHIGKARQNPFELDEMQVDKLLALLRRVSPKVHAAATRV